MNKALFLDRDGVINKKGKSYYIHREEDFEFNKGIFDALKTFADKGYKIIIITNQGGIAKGLYTEEDTRELHGYMVEQFAREGIKITAVYFCPHHPDIEECNCRKPGNQLFEQAISDFEIDRNSSLMIGDSEIDIEAARRSGIKGILVEPNSDLTTIHGLIPE